MKLSPVMINNLNASTLCRPPKLDNQGNHAMADAPRPCHASEVKLAHSLNTLTASSQQDIDEARVDTIKQAIISGKYSINAERIAQGLLDDICLPF